MLVVKMCVIHNVITFKNIYFQSGGALLGPPGAPGAPVSTFIVMPKVNPLHCTVEKH